jgi:hypothetical protein
MTKTGIQVCPLPASMSRPAKVATPCRSGRYSPLSEWRPCADEFIGRLRGELTDPEILDLTICLSASLGLGRTPRALGITETSLADV